MPKYKIGITEAGDAGLDLSWANKLDTVDGAIVITKCITPDFYEVALANKDMMSIRAGEYQKEDGMYLPEFFEMVNDLEKRLAYAKENTSLPSNPNMKKVEEFVMSVNRRAIDE